MLSPPLVPDTAQIVNGWPISSTSIRIQWTKVLSADHYYLMVHSQATGQTLNLTHTNTTAVVQSLHPSTNYDCYVYTANLAGLGSRSKVKTIATCECDIDKNVKRVTLYHRYIQLKYVDK